MKKASASKSKASHRRVRELFRTLIVALAFGALVSVPLLSRYTRTVQAVGDVSLNTMGVAATQNFDTWASTPVNTNVTWTDGTTLTGWYAQFTATPSNPTTYRIGTGSDTTG